MENKEIIYLEFEYASGPIQFSGRDYLCTMVDKVDNDVYIKEICTTVANLMTSLFMETDEYNNFELVDKENLQIYHDLLKRLGDLCKYRLYCLKDDSFEIEDHLDESLEELFTPYIKSRTKVSSEILDLKLGYLEGPLPFIDIETRKPNTKFKIVNEDQEIQVLNYKISKLYTSFYYSKDEYNPLEFDYDALEKNTDSLNSLMNQLKKRLKLINDGSFTIK